eukprot:TRINITY_DN2764_c0_g1_i3.p1 TRINITY_DN2764_c0_g1~~TRINITY_DN2764_c0_g1_i3.p1  ORF type:complete len:572 (-),score=47.46 TRINITY_DN2764_c0_g1_i3:97-1812(-)
MKDWCTGQRASVHQGALHLFINICRTTNFQEQVLAACHQGKRIMFTGHSMGGAVAILAALGILELISCHSRGLSEAILCITFGFPLIGDEIFARAVRRENWADRFCHVVLWHDVFARILLAPSQDVFETVQKFIPYLQSSRVRNAVKSKVMESAVAEEEVWRLVITVLQHCNTVANYTSAANMSPTNSLLAAVRPLLRLSPYRPFGRYVFLRDDGGIWLDNYEAILPLLLYGLQDLSSANLKMAVFEHASYGTVLGRSCHSFVHLDNLWDLPLSQTEAVFQDKRVSAELEMLGLGIENVPARLSLRAAGEILKGQQVKKTEAERELFQKINKALSKVEDYRLQCLQVYRTCYYDCFRRQEKIEDFNANLNRVELAGYFDQIIEMIEKHELPDEFQGTQEFLKLGNWYRLLVEPLDIANFYRLDKNQESGPYIQCGRPRRYKYFEYCQKEMGFCSTNQSMASAGRDSPFLPSNPLTQDSCLWAHLEEIVWMSKHGDRSSLEFATKWNELQTLMKSLIESNRLCVDEIMVCHSLFRTCWQEYLTEDDRRRSLLHSHLSNATPVAPWSSTQYNL